MSERLVAFLRRFYSTTGIKLDPIYNGKAMMALYDMAQRGELHAPAVFGGGGGEGGGRERSPCRVLFINTGGMQGLAGVEQRLGYKLFSD